MSIIRAKSDVVNQFRPANIILLLGRLDGFNTNAAMTKIM